MMTEEQINKLAELIVEKILVRQAEYDAEFVKQMEQEHNVQLEFVDAHKQMIEDEIVKLEKRLQKLLDREMYEAAARLVEQINNLKKHL
jgi:protein-arginine kinase activator protein McsA